MEQGQKFEVVGTLINAGRNYLVLSIQDGTQAERHTECVFFGKFLLCERVGEIIKEIDRKTSIEEVRAIIDKVRGEKPFTLSVVQMNCGERYVGY